MNENIEIDRLQKKIDYLQRHYADLRTEIRQISDKIELMSAISKETISLMASHEKLAKMHKILTESLEDNLIYEIMDPRCTHNIFYPKITSHQDTMQQLMIGKSLVRYGDGEFSIISGQARPPFQKNDSALAERLKEILSQNKDNILVAIADNYGNLSKYTHSAAHGIREYMTPSVRREHMCLLNPNRTYHDAYISRPYLIKEDKDPEKIHHEFNEWKQLWNGRNVIVVEGAGTRAGSGNDFFSNTQSIRRIICPARNSFDKYEEILSKCLDIAEKERDCLFLAALGPTATVLCYDLADRGYQAIDIGHLDIEYEWFLAGQGDRIPIKNKLTQESPEATDEYDEEELQEYFQQIVWDLSAQ